MAVWHAELTRVQLTLRRYQTDDAAAAYGARLPYDAVASAEIRDGRAWLEGMLVAGPALTRDDRRRIEALLRAHGAVVLDADRHGRLVQRER